MINTENNATSRKLIIDIIHITGSITSLTAFMILILEKSFIQITYGKLIAYPLSASFGIGLLVYSWIVVQYVGKKIEIKFGLVYKVGYYLLVWPFALLVVAIFEISFYALIGE